MLLFICHAKLHANWHGATRALTRVMCADAKPLQANRSRSLKPTLRLEVGGVVLYDIIIVCLVNSTVPGLARELLYAALHHAFR